jgi:hypothetical protein
MRVSSVRRRGQESKALQTVFLLLGIEAQHRNLSEQRWREGGINLLMVGKK